VPKVKCGDCAFFHPYPEPYDWEGWCGGDCSWDSIYMGTNWRLNVRKRDRMRYCRAFKPKTPEKKEAEKNEHR
jgi:hypothetical protein